MRLVGKIKNVNLIRKIAWNFHKTTGIEWEELFAEALFRYVLLLQENELDEDESKGKISTLIWISISNALKSYIEQYGRINQPLDHIDNMDEVDWNTHSTSPFWERLTNEGQMVAKIILTYSEHFVCLTPDEVKQRLTYILTKIGWSADKITAGISDVENAFN